jgi:transposase-like protein
MIDVVSIIIGMCIVLAIFLIGFIIVSRNEPFKVTVIDPTIANDLVNEEPRCPECGSFDLTLVDNCDGVPWLKGHTSEIDYYQCNRCSRRFNDEDWQTYKGYNT